MTQTARPPRPQGVARQAIWTALSNLALPITAIASGPILAHTLGPVARGEMTAAITPVFILMFLANLGLPEAATYGVAALRQTPGAVFLRCSLLSLGSGAVAAVALWFLAPVLLHSSPDVIPLLRTTLFFLPGLMIVILLRSTVNGMREFRAINIERIGTPVLRLLAFVVLLLLGSLTVRSAALSQVTATIIGGCFLFIVLLRKRSTSAAWSATRQEPVDEVADESLTRADVVARRRAAAGRPPTMPGLTRALGAYGAKGWGSVFGNLVNWRLDQLVLIALVSPYQLGLYVVAVHFAEIPSTAINALRNLIFAEAAHRGDSEIIVRTARLVTFLVGLMAVGGSLVAPLLVKILAGDAFMPAVWMTRILLVGAVPFCVEQVVGAGLLASGTPGRRSLSQLVAAVFTVVGLLVLAPMLGGLGAALTSLTAYTVSMVITIVQFRRVYPMPLSHILVVRRSDLVWFVGRLRSLARRAPRVPAPVETEDVLPAPPDARSAAR